MLLLQEKDLWAVVVFVVAASTDFVDGYIARATNSVSKIGQLLDPLVDRALLITGVVGLLLVGRLPIWVILVVIARDVYLVCAGAHLMYHYHERVAVMFPGKVATTLLYIGFGGLMLNMPQIPGLGITQASWLPGFTSASVSWGIWFVYAGLLLSLVVTGLYVYKGYLIKWSQRSGETEKPDINWLDAKERIAGESPDDYGRLREMRRKALDAERTQPEHDVSAC